MVRIKEQTSFKLIFKRDWTKSSKFLNYFTLINEHNWEDLCMHSTYQQTCIPIYYHNYILGGSIFNPIVVDAFILDLLIQVKFHCLDVISRSWGSWKNVSNYTHIYSGGCTPSYILHTRAFGTYLSGGYLPCIKYYKVWYFSK
jgi:hypothetical protein